jgi:hypothetical protein
MECKETSVQEMAVHSWDAAFFCMQQFKLSCILHASGYFLRAKNCCAQLFGALDKPHPKIT